MQINRIGFLCAAILCGLIPLYAGAAIDAYEFTTHEEQVRYEQLVNELRCPMCLNTNLSGSDSMIAKDLRREIHRMVVAGKSSDDIRDFMYERYGDFILYKPKVKSSTYLLWFGPLLLLVVGLIVLARFITRKKLQKAEALSSTDQNRLQSILDQNNSE